MINRRGYEVIPEEEYYDDIMGVLKQKYPTMSENPANLLCIFARIMARNENARDYDRVTSYSDAYVATATGMALSKAVRTAGIARLPGTRAVGRVIVSKDPSRSQTIIPRNMRILSGNFEFETTNATAVIMNEDSMEFEITSIDVGSDYNVSSGSKFKTVLNILGVTGIVANSDVFGGTDEEADLPLRERYFARMNASSNSALSSVISSVQAITDVYLCSGDENVSDVEVNGLLPHSFIIYAAGGTDQEIAEVVMKTKPAGVQMNGDISVPVLVSGKEHVVKFSRYENQTVYFTLEVAIDRATAPSDFVTILQDSIVKYTQSNKSIVAYELTNYISQEITSVRGIKTLLFGTEPNPTSNETIVSPSGLNFMAERDNIQVTVI